MPRMNTISLATIVLFSAAATPPRPAPWACQVVVESSWGRRAYACGKYKERLFLPLEAVAELVSGGRTLEPGLALRPPTLLAIPAMDGSDKDAKVEGAWLQLNPKLAAAGRSVVISSGVVQAEGQAWVPVDDFARATGAPVRSDSRELAEIQVTHVAIPRQCERCPLVTTMR